MDLETERLTLRGWRTEDAERLLDILGRTEVMRWLGDGPTVVLTEIEEARARIVRWNDLSQTPPLGCWAVERTADGVLIGAVLLLTLPNAVAGEVEIGWWLHPDAWGRGYATEAARAVMAHGFAAGLPEILAVTHLANEPSMNVCRKLEMSYAGVVHEWYDADLHLFRRLSRGRP